MRWWWLSLAIVALCTLRIAAVFTPCNGKSMLGGDCDGNSDCEYKGSVCLRGKCRCHPHYIEVVDDKGQNKHCQLLPAKIGAQCSTKCREPLFCRNGGCQCVQRGTTTLINGECISISRVGDRCTRHYDCTAPFSACLNNQCVCITGTIQQGSACVAAANCPFGGLPGAQCVLKSAPGSAFNLPPNQSNCPTGQVCITAEDSSVGHCCPVVCPLSSHVDTKYSCDPTADSMLRCPTDTHFCHMLSDSYFSQAVCCRRPCNAMAPNALYAHNQCLPRGQLNAACTTNAQCGGGESMECIKEWEDEDEVVTALPEVVTEKRRSVGGGGGRPTNATGTVKGSDDDDLLFRARLLRRVRVRRAAVSGRFRMPVHEGNAIRPLTSARIQRRQGPRSAPAKALSPPIAPIAPIMATPTTAKPVKERKRKLVGQCQCLSGFTPALDSLTNPRSNPSQTCVRECSSMELARDTSCFSTVPLGGQCFIQRQCPMNAGCYRGRCMCKCGFQLGKGDKCIPLPPPPTTTPPPQRPGIPAAGAGILSLFNQFFGGGQGTGAFGG